MAVYKDNATGTWRVIYRFTNWKGERKQTQKRGFATKREAQAWEHEVMLKQNSKLDMTFASFFELYEADKKQRVKESTWESKSHVIRTKILPYFGNRKIAEIEAKDIIAWQNELMAYQDEKGKPYSADYLKTIHAQLTAIFNHAVNFYNLPYNPARRAGTMGNEIPKEMDFWTKEEYLKFSEAMMDKPRSFYAFEMLYWCGIRSGELLALTAADFDFQKQTVTISKTYHRSKGRDIITSPKTAKSNRTVKMPPFLCEEMQEYIKMFYDINPDERLFTVTKSYLNHEMERGAKQAGVKKIRVHDIRHTIKPRLLAAGADCSKVLVIDDTDQPLTMADIRLEEAIIQTKARMVVLDPIQGFLGAEVDMHRANEIRPLMKRIAVLAEKYHCAIILIGHMNKNSNGKSSYRGLGSIDFQAAARSVLIVGRIKEEPETRVVCHTKSSLAPEGKSIAFRLDKDNGFEWIGEYDISADELLNGDGKGQKSRKAKEFLLEILADGGMSQKKILEEAAKHGIKGKTLRNAKSELEVDSIKRGNQWYWVLPE